ncbi:MAG TPA: acetate/propionate family kinase [Bryobacteraceae bacterium]|nr:acetate/propionate family kinase [Bryobacteraceae bacterium]
MKILVLNGGSSSFKSSLFEVTGLQASPPRPLWEARVDWEHHPGTAEIQIQADGSRSSHGVSVKTPLDSLGPLMEMLPHRAEIHVAGHRVVHGGRAFRESTRITKEVRAGIARMASFAPEHNRLELEAIECVERILGPDAAQVAVFDTAFHASLPPPAYVYPGPYEWLGQGIRRYGFHGISHQYTSRRAAEILGRDLPSLRMITCHLGNGCSLAAIRDGVSVDTTMGFTPLEGLMMGTRSGTIDPGIIIHLVRHLGYRAEELDRVLNKESGLRGVSGISGDMRAVMEAMDRGEVRAQLAFDVFVHRLCAEIGAMLSSLGGLDALVFTAGVGENSPRVRARAAEAFAFLGVKLDASKNAASPVDADVAAADSAVRVLVVHTREEWEIARESFRVVNG